VSEEFEVLKIVTERLNKTNIAYMVSGSIAANYYTVPRMTRDIDIVIELKAEDSYKLIDLFQKDFYVDRKVIEREILRQGMFNLIHNEYVVKIDFILKKNSAYEQTAFRRKKSVSIEKNPIWFISAEDLIISKLNWAKDTYSEMQLKDVHNLMETVVNLDRAYINGWILDLGLREIYNKTKQ